MRLRHSAGLRHGNWVGVLQPRQVQAHAHELSVHGGKIEACKAAVLHPGIDLRSRETRDCRRLPRERQECPVQQGAALSHAGTPHAVALLQGRVHGCGFGLHEPHVVCRHVQAAGHPPSRPALLVGRVAGHHVYQIHIGALERRLHDQGQDLQPRLPPRVRVGLQAVVVPQIRVLRVRHYG